MSVKDAADLYQHERPWDILIVARIIFTLFAALAAVPVELTMRRSYWDYEYGITKRFNNTVTGNTTCSIAALFILVTRSEWSLVHLANSQPNAPSTYWGACGKFLLATLLYEIGLLTHYPFGRLLYPPIILLLAVVPGLTFMLVVVLLMLVIWLHWPQIKERAPLNWSLIVSALLTAICLIAVVDLMLFVDDIARW